MTVESVQGSLQLDRQAQWIQVARRSAALLRHFRTDVLPQVAEHRHLVARDVLGNRYTWQLHNAALDRIHQREVAHRPGKERSLGIPGPA